MIGGRMEVVSTRRSLAGSDYLRLLVLAVVSLAVHGWLLMHTAVTARDGIDFARIALSIQSPHDTQAVREGSGTHRLPKVDPNRIALDVIKEAKQHPGYSLSIWMAGKLVRKAVETPAGPEPNLPECYLLAAQLVSSGAALLLIVPMYLLGRTLIGRNPAFAAALFFQILPLPARTTADALTEGLYMLGVTTALFLGVRAVRQPGVGRFIICGIAAGATYLVRPEGLIVAAGVGAVALGMGLTRRWPRDLAMGRIIALAFGVALTTCPYMMLIQNITNKPTGTNLMNEPGEVLRRFGRSASITTNSPALIAKWREETSHTPVVLWGVAAAAEETGRGMTWLVLALAGLGLIANRRKIFSDPGACSLVAVFALNFALIASTAIVGGDSNGKRVHYVAEKHTILLVMIGCITAASALRPATVLLSHLPHIGFVWAGRLAPVSLMLAVACAALPATLKPLHAHREGFKHAGIWMKDHCEQGSLVIDPFSWSQWYAWQSLYYVPDDPIEDPNACFTTYAILDQKNRSEDHERLPRIDQARAVAADGRSRVVYHWPENVEQSAASVVVYKLVRCPGK